MKVTFLYIVFTFYLLISFYSFFVITNRSIKNTNSNNSRHKSHERSFSRFIGPATADKIKEEFIETESDKRYWDQWAPLGIHSHNFSLRKLDFNGTVFQPVPVTKVLHTVDIWSNNGLGDYLWTHLIKGRLQIRNDRLYAHGEKIINSTNFRYKSGSGLDPSIISDATENLVLILNGRSNTTLASALQWLNEIPDLPTIQNVGLMLIGNEQCDNSWLKSYMSSGNKSELRFAFIVYDSPLVDHLTVFQFPLGVAAYRGFPMALYPDIAAPGKREYLCNFLGTVYKNSSREVLHKLLSTLQTRYKCYMRIREEWQPGETESSLQSYVDVLRNSDLTLCPVGMNAESYRIYEALSMGSLPVLEDRTTSGSCDPVPFRILKQYNAPVIYIKDWVLELPPLLEKENILPVAEKVRRRQIIIDWYSEFRRKIAHKFASTVIQKFFIGTQLTDNE